MSWAQFKEECTDKFVPASYRDAKAEEFFRLEQGTLSVTDYERSFSELVRHVPFIRDDEVSKTKRFVVGLSPAIRTTVASTTHTQYDQVIEAAVRVERSMGLKSKATPSQGQKQSGLTWVQGGSSKQSKRGGKTQWTGGSRPNQGAQSSQGSVRHKQVAPRVQSQSVLSVGRTIMVSADWEQIAALSADSRDTSP